MLQSVDSAIKLFGKTIPRQTCNNGTAISENSAVFEPNSCPYGKTEFEAPQKDNSEEHAEKCSADEQDGPMSSSKLKKPDKILPCPRCFSMETKFCYYNNYNINQPRHFCKSCQRYWTDGGAMRNVPVGAGRRKNKSSSSHSRNISSVPSPSFGSESSISESMASTQENTGLPGQIPWAVSYQPLPLSPYPLFYPFGYWSCWPAPWISQPYSTTAESAYISSTSSSSSSSPSSSSPTLGKHSRDGGILVPKTLRVDDPQDAAKSSIWSTLGIEAEKRGRLVNPLHSKCNEDQTSSHHMIIHEIS